MIFIYGEGVVHCQLRNHRFVEKKNFRFNLITWNYHQYVQFGNLLLNKKLVQLLFCQLFPKCRGNIDIIWEEKGGSCKCTVCRAGLLPHFRVQSMEGTLLLHAALYWTVIFIAANFTWIWMNYSHCNYYKIAPSIITVCVLFYYWSVGHRLTGGKEATPIYTDF